MKKKKDRIINFSGLKHKTHSEVTLKDFSKLKKDLITTLRETLSGKKQIDESNEFFQEIYEFRASEEKKHASFSFREKLSFATVFCLLVSILTLAVGYLYSFIGLKEVVISNNTFYLILASAIPFSVWIISTDENFWAFHKRKRLFFYLCCFHLFFLLMQPVYSLVRNLVSRAILSIKPDEVLTLKMLLLLVYVGILILMGVICIVLFSQLEPLLTSQNLRKQIELFKLSHFVDDREDREYKYDISTIKDLETGRSITVKERDRMNQLEINGASGTGKTTSIFLPVIEKDLDQKIKNQEKRQEELLKLIQEKKATIRGPVTKFKESDIIAIGKTKTELERNKKTLSRIRKKYADCGMTIIAPNASLITDIIRICKARDIAVNVLDPIGDYTLYDNARTVGINPFYVPLGLSEEDRAIYISQAATVFAEVLIATNQMNGAASDVYFTDISLSVSSNIAAVVMLAKNLRGEQAYIDDVQNCISNFQNIRPYVTAIEDYYHIKISALKLAANKKMDSEDMQKAKEKMNAQENLPGSRQDATKNPYYQQLLFVTQELLGAGSEDMFSQARGLRNLINKVLQDTRIKRKLSERDHSRIDFDQILSENQITVVNTAIELGKSASTAFGLFFILLHKVSVLRRPIETRTPHFLWIDEASQYMHPCYEDMISLYRQYVVSVVITLQSLTQTEKNHATAYLKNVFLGAGTHIVFGRLSAEEMKIYSEMGGIVRENVEQKSYSASSILTSDPGYTESVRTSPAINNILEGSDLRLLDFQELTIFTTNNGRVLPGRLARVFFLKEDAFDTRRIRKVLWEKVVPEAFHSEEKLPQEEPVIPLRAVMEIPKEQTEELLNQNMHKEILLEDNEPEEEIDLQNLTTEELFALLEEECKNERKDPVWAAEQGSSADKEEEFDFAKGLDALNRR